MKEQFNVRSMVMIGMFTAVLAVLSILEIPMPSGVPITLQTFAVALCGYVLGWKRGAACGALYLLIGTIGVPVFAGMSGGISKLLGPTGGFIFGFIFLAGLCGVGAACKNKMLAVIAGLVGLAVCHLLGAIQFSVVTNTGFVQSLLLVSVPYLVKDVLSVIGALLAGSILRKRLMQANLINHGQIA
ncbi:MAG: biotin transporter BioY [Eubacteriales bacterium]|nr:biotin transporter BioY [Eubacteriales bacterium]